MNLHTVRPTGPAQNSTELSKTKEPRDAAREFEALLIGQLLGSAFSAPQMGLEGDGDSGSQTMLDFGREHLSRVIAQGGGLGLAKMIEPGLAKDKPSNAAALLLKR